MRIVIEWRGFTIAVGMTEETALLRLLRRGVPTDNIGGFLRMRWLTFGLSTPENASETRCGDAISQGT